MPWSLLEASLLAECMMTPWGLQSLKVLNTEQMPFCTQEQDFEPKPSSHPEMIMEVPQWLQIQALGFAYKSKIPSFYWNIWIQREVYEQGVHTGKFNLYDSLLTLLSFLQLKQGRSWGRGHNRVGMQSLMHKTEAWLNRTPSDEKGDQFTVDPIPLCGLSWEFPLKSQWFGFSAWFVPSLSLHE